MHGNGNGGSRRTAAGGWHGTGRRDHARGRIGSTEGGGQGSVGLFQGRDIRDSQTLQGVLLVDAAVLEANRIKDDRIAARAAVVVQQKETAGMGRLCVVWFQRGQRLVGVDAKGKAFKRKGPLPTATSPGGPRRSVVSQFENCNATKRTQPRYSEEQMVSLE